MWENILNISFLNNSLLNYLRALGIVLGGILLVWTIKRILLKKLRSWAANTTTKIDDLIIDLVSRYIVPLCYLGFFGLGTATLHLSKGVAKGLTTLSTIVFTIVAILMAMHIVRYGIFEMFLGKKPKSGSEHNRFQALMPAVSVIVWGVGLLFLMENLGFKISAVMAGLGIGGVAVALAASTVLGDLFSYVAIMFDEPFVLGDFVIVGEFMGTVEHIGIKTTRLRSLGGEQLIFSNKDLTDSRIRNYKRMDSRRVLFRLGVTYDTPLEKLKEIPVLLKKIIESTPSTLFDRAHFYSFGDFNLVIEIVYFVLSPDYNIHMDIQQTINFAIKEEFEKRAIEFAFPTQTIHINNPMNGAVGSPSNAPTAN